MRWKLVGSLVGAVALSACGFTAVPDTGAEDLGSGDDTGSGATPGSGSDPGSNTPTPPAGQTIANLATGDDSLLGTGDLITQNGTKLTINTGGSTPTLTGVALPTGVTLDVVNQDGSSKAPELAVLRARTVSLSDTVTVSGTRPLVIVCDTFASSADFTSTAHTQQTGININIGGGGAFKDAGALTQADDGAIEVYAQTSMSISAPLTAGNTTDQGFGPGGPQGGDSGVIVLQSKTLNNNTMLQAGDGKPDSAIFLLVDSLINGAAAMTSPKPIQSAFKLSP